MYFLPLPLCLDPRKTPDGGVSGPIGNYGVPITYERSFRWKVSNFRNLCVIVIVHLACMVQYNVAQLTCTPPLP